jgi:hypothetical protein
MEAKLSVGLLLQEHSSGDCVAKGALSSLKKIGCG